VLEVDVRFRGFAPKPHIHILSHPTYAGTT
jgi:hypothetical protein